MKSKFIILLTLFHFGIAYSSICQNAITGRIFDLTTGQPLRNAMIKTTNADVATSSDSVGYFSLAIKTYPTVLHISHVGYKALQLAVINPSTGLLEIMMEAQKVELEEVVISTGYQQIGRERITGSFTPINNELFNRRVTTDILSRLEDVVPGLVFNRRLGASNISIRGRNTINGDGQPLIVLDNFPYEGDISSINPNDIENVTVLRDAAASSIWGARAGNGVIVINTRKGGYNRQPELTFNANITLAEKPNLYYQPLMSSSDYIEWEQFLFQKGYYNSFQNNANKVAFTPAVELLFQNNSGQISNTELSQRLAELKGYDLRKDMDKYLYQSSINQQYSLSLSGGSAQSRYALAVGYDKVRASTIGDIRERITLNANHTYGLFNKKVEFNTGIFYGVQALDRNSIGELTYTGTRSVQPLYPYARLVSSDGEPLVVEKNHRLLYVDQTEALGLLNWKYNPLEELAFMDKTTRIRELRLRADLNYKIFPFLKAEISYQFQSSSSLLRDNYILQSYFARNLINTYTQITENKQLAYPVPLGGILDLGEGSVAGNSLRAQLNFSKKLRHGEFDGIAGAEVRDHYTDKSNSRRYGYNDEYATSVQVNSVQYFPSFVNSNSKLLIPSNSAQSYLVDRYVSYYSNFAYNLDKKYVLTGSMRMDQSNLFGVKSNQKGVPLWSSGVAWILSSEKFMSAVPFSYLRLRTTYGSSGNVNKSISAKTTASFSPTDFYSMLPYATIQNPPNPELRWEKVKMVNFAVDYEHSSGRLGGTVEYYRKRGTDLFAQVPYQASTGISTFSGNVAETRGHGIDLTVNTKIYQGNLNWEVFSMISYVSDKVTNYKVVNTARSFAQSSETTGIPLAGKPQYALYSFKFAGLNPSNGEPLGFLNGEVSNQWSKILQSTTFDQLHYHGPARPTVFGSLRNNLAWKGFTVSANISYRLGYYFRRSSVNYTYLWQGSPVHGDYEKRWLQPGDENITSIPSNPGGNNADRTTFYLFSSALIDKADHMRLQDIQISYALKNPGTHSFSNTQFYVYANNLGILWKASKTSLDPDYPVANYPPQRSLAFGVRFTL
jgi:TonB-linked SusC/RagA family outer membrane protein